MRGSDEEYLKLTGLDPETSDVFDLAAAWVRESRCTARPCDVRLYVVRAGPGEPFSTEEAAAATAAATGQAYLQPRLTLRDAGIAPGSSLLAFVAAKSTQPAPALSERLVKDAPSTFGMPSRWQAAQFPSHGEPPLLCFTPPHAFPAALPASLVSPVFGHFVDRVAAAAPVSAADGAAVLELCTAMCDRVYKLEEERARVLLEHLKTFGFKAEFVSVPGCSARFDGLLVVDVAGVRVVLAVGEWKNGIAASSTDPEYQLNASVYHVVRAAAEQGLRVFAETPYPVLGLEVVGRMIRFSAMACLRGEHVQWEPLTPFLNLLPMAQAQPAQLYVLAAALCAFRDALAELRAEVQDALAAAPRAPPAGEAWARSPAVALPYPLRDGARFRDVRPLEVASRALMYAALVAEVPPERGAGVGSKRPREDAAAAAPPPRVLIKYVHGGYGAAVHAAWATAGLAPALRSWTELPGGFTEVVMDELPAERWCCASHLSDAELLACDADARVARALTRAHALRLGSAGDERGCHGDCRPANVILRRDWPQPPGDEDDGVRFIDFDWAGTEGAARYPAFMNVAVPWPAGAAPGALLTQAHDVALWRAARNILQG